MKKAVEHAVILFSEATVEYAALTHYNRDDAAKAMLGLKDKAQKDFETALELARNANNTKIRT